MGFERWRKKDNRRGMGRKHTKKRNEAQRAIQKEAKRRTTPGIVCNYVSTCCQAAADDARTRDPLMTEIGAPH